MVEVVVDPGPSAAANSASQSSKKASRIRCERRCQRSKSGGGVQDQMCP